MGQFIFGLLAGIVVGLVMEWVIDWTGLLPKRPIGKQVSPRSEERAGQSSASASLANRAEEPAPTGTPPSTSNMDANGE